METNPEIPFNKKQIVYSTTSVNARFVKVQISSRVFMTSVKFDYTGYQEIKANET